MSDTPRTDAATKAAIEHGTGDVWFVAMKLERELNAANDRIMLLEEAGIVAIYEAVHGREDDALEIWRKAMEAKP